MTSRHNFSWLSVAHVCQRFARWLAPTSLTGKRKLWRACGSPQKKRTVRSDSLGVVGGATAYRRRNIEAMINYNIQRTNLSPCCNRPRRWNAVLGNVFDWRAFLQCDLRSVYCQWYCHKLSGWFTAKVLQPLDALKDVELLVKQKQYNTCLP